MKIKVCGMKYEDNITQVAALQPDYLGFMTCNLNLYIILKAWSKNSF